MVTQNLTEGTWAHPVEPYYWVEIERRDEIGCVVLLMIDEAFLRPWQFNRECDQVVRWEDCAWRPK